MPKALKLIIKLMVYPYLFILTLGLIAMALEPYFRGM
jgi:hypothetical protein